MSVPAGCHAFAASGDPFYPQWRVGRESMMHTDYLNI
jgi:hypothetical protein